MKVISIASLKGGVGKSGLSISLSNEASRRMRTISLDLDSQASLTDFYLREEDPRTILNRNIFHFLNDSYDIDSVVYKSLFHSVIPSAINLSSIGAVKSGDPSAILEHKEEIRSLEYDSMFIDCPPSPTYETRLGIACSDIVLVPISNDRWSIQGFPLLMNEIRKLEKINLFTGKVFAIPSLVTEKEGESIRNILKSLGVNILSRNYLKKPKIKSSLSRGERIKNDSMESELINGILEELL